MATLISSATGNLTASGTWSTVDSGSLLDLETGTSTPGTTYSGSRSSAFTPGAITVDGIAIKLATRAASPTGTISVALYNDTLAADVVGSEVTLNVSDLPTAANSAAANEGGWIFFKFASPVLLITLTNYRVEIKTSSTNQVTLFRDSTTFNWSRLLRTTTNAAPGAGDNMHVLGEHTGAGTGNNLTVTMDSTAATDYGGGSTTLASMSVCKRGTLTWGSSSSTAYILQLSGLLVVYNGGAYNQGTVATPIPSTSSAVLQFDCAADGDFGFIARNGSTVVIQGNPLTYDRALLTADASAAATSLTTDVSTGWLNGDEIGIASTTRTASECEKKSLTAGASGTTLTIAAITNAHKGTSPVQAELINLTRNVKIKAVTTTLVAYVVIKSTASIDVDWTEFSYLGENASGKRGVEFETSTGSANFNRCSFHDFEDFGLYLGVSMDNVTISNCVVYNVCSVTGGLNSGGIGLYNFSAGTNWSITGNIVIRCAAASTAAFYMLPIGGTFQNNVAVGAARSGCYFPADSNAATCGTFGDFTAHSNGANGIEINNSNKVWRWPGNIILWRNSSPGISIQSTQRDTQLGDVVAFGNTPSSFVIASTNLTTMSFNSFISNGDTTFSTASAVDIQGTAVNLQIYNSDFGSVSGIKTAHTQDILISSGFFVQAYLYNTKLASATEVSGNTTMAIGSFVSSQKHDQTAGLHKTWFPYGIVSIDTVIYDVTPSARGTPNNASNKLEIPIGKANVANGATITFSVKVRESVVGDGTDYNGNRIRLIVKKNVAAGITSDTVLATATVASEGAFETISGTTASVTDDAVLQFVVDCDGTTGWINVDTATVS